MTLIAGGVQASRLCFIHRQKPAWQRALLGALVFAALAHYPFVSVASLHVPGAASAVISGLAEQERITQAIHDVFPAVLRPLSENARQLRAHFKTCHCEKSGPGRMTKQSSWIATPGSR
jgi:hypothetical protein